VINDINELKQGITMVARIRRTRESAVPAEGSAGQLIETEAFEQLRESSASYGFRTMLRRVNMFPRKRREKMLEFVQELRKGSGVEFDHIARILGTTSGDEKMGLLLWEKHDVFDTLVKLILDIQDSVHKDAWSEFPLLIGSDSFFKRSMKATWTEETGLWLWRNDKNKLKMAIKIIEDCHKSVGREWRAFANIIGKVEHHEGYRGRNYVQHQKWGVGYGLAHFSNFDETFDLCARFILKYHEHAKGKWSTFLMVIGMSNTDTGIGLGRGKLVDQIGLGIYADSANQIRGKIKILEMSEEFKKGKFKEAAIEVGTIE